MRVGVEVATYTRWGAAALPTATDTYLLMPGLSIPPPRYVLNAGSCSQSGWRCGGTSSGVAGPSRSSGKPSNRPNGPGSESDCAGAVSGETTMSPAASAATAIAVCRPDRITLRYALIIQTTTW